MRLILGIQAKMKKFRKRKSFFQKKILVQSVLDNQVMKHKVI
jgi:hypothetical protein